MLSTSTLQTHIHTVLQPSYSSRYHRTIASINAHLFPHGITLPSQQSALDVAGGYFIWLELPEALEASRVAERCMQEEELMIAEGPMFKVNVEDSVGEKGNCFEKFVRVCFAWEDGEVLEEGIERLGRVVGRMLERKGGVK